MKRLFALILALVMCLGLCACGNNKYVGTYSRKDGKDEIFYTINSDGTCDVECIALEGYDFNDISYKVGDTTLTEQWTWEIVDGFLVLDGEDQYKLEGIYLVNYKYPNIKFTKVD